MILPIVFLVIAVACLVGLLHTEWLIAQVVLAFWTVVATMGAAQTSTDESVAERRKAIQEAKRNKSRVDSSNG